MGSTFVYAQDGAEGGYSTQDNTASFDSNISTNDINVDPGTVGYAEITANETANADGTVSFNGTTVVGPEGTTAEVTVNSDGSYTVSFTSPGNDINPVQTDVTFDSSQTDNAGNSVGGGGDTITIDAPDPNPTYPFIEGGAPSLTATTSCQGSQPVIDLSWTPSPLSNGITHDWRILKSGVFGTYVTRWRTDTNFRDGMVPPQQVLDPETIYYYRVYGYMGVHRSPLSNIVGVLTPSCAPLVVASCPNTNPGTIENLNLSWSSNSSNISGFRIYRGTNNNVLTRNYMPPNISPSVTSFVDSNLVNTQTYNYWLTSYKTVITPAYTEITSTDENGNPTGFIDHPQTSVDIESPFSGMSEGKQPQLCETVTPPVTQRPTINLYLNNQPHFDLPLTVNLNLPVSLRWQVSDAISCIASSNPIQSYWNGSQNEVSGIQPITTDQLGEFEYILSCSNPAGNTTVTSRLFVIEPIKAFIKTTQGDVHSNSEINVPE